MDVDPIYESPDIHNIYDFVKSPALDMSDGGPSGVELELAENPAYGTANVSTAVPQGSTESDTDSYVDTSHP